MQEQLELLNGKLDLLLKKYSELQAEHKELKQTVAQQLKTIDKLNAKLKDAEQDMTSSKIGSSVTDKEKEVFRKQLDTVIGDIDKILTTLND
jgi:soluble cytochrome b562